MTLSGQPRRRRRLHRQLLERHVRHKNVGTGKTVTVSGISISGTDAGNYTFNTTATTTANITARGLTVSATGVNKVYDGNTTATVTLSRRPGLRRRR